MTLAGSGFKDFPIERFCLFQDKTPFLIDVIAKTQKKPFSLTIPLMIFK